MSVIDFRVIRDCFVELDKALAKCRAFSPPVRADDFQLLWAESSPVELVFQHKTCKPIRLVFNIKNKQLQVIR